MLLPWRGQPLIRHVVQTALASQLAGVVVVTGHDAPAVSDAITGLPVQLVHNAEYETGLSASLRAGLHAVPGDATALVVLLGDQPLLTAPIIDRLIATYRQTAAVIVAPVAAGKRGNPVLFDRVLFSELCAVTGDAGARDVIEAHWTQVAPVEVAAHIFEDVDTPETYRRLLAAEHPI